MTKKRIYLIHPKTPDNFWAMKGALNIVGKHKSMMPNAGLLTLISLTPPDLDIEYIFCDENISPIDWNIECDLIGITGYTLQAERMKTISTKFRERGIPIAIGGIYATINPEDIKDYADHLFIGEAEYTWPQFLRDWSEQKELSLYKSDGYVDMKDSPAPDLSFIKAKNYHYFPVQTSRGCPNNCDFCDVIRVIGRKYRSKSIDQIMQEVKNAYEIGAETVFFSDDNFYVNRTFTINLLKEIIKWNTTLSRPLSFSTQATVRIGDDDELLKLFADARFSVIFLGLETVNKECLEEVNKGQMAKYDPYEVIPRIASYGIVPFLGMIVGFDHDDTSVFGTIENFLQETGSPIASISVLNAPANTALYERMKKNGRLIDNFKGFWHFTTNVMPKSMTLKELYTGHHQLFKKIYEPENFLKRMITYLGSVTYFSDLYTTRRKTLYRIPMIFKIFWHFTFRVPASVRKIYYSLLKKTWEINPRLISRAVSVMVQYWHYYEFSHSEEWQKIGFDSEEPLGTTAQ